MNKIEKKDFDLIRRTVDIAEANDIENILFFNKKIKGRSIENGLFILQDVEEDFPYPKLALSRLSIFKKRLALLDSLANYEVFYEADDTKVKQLIFKGKRTSIEFRCINPDTLEKLPHKVTDPIMYEFDMDAETLNILNRITTAMNVDLVTFCGNKNDVNLTIKVMDADTNEVLTHTLPSTLKWNAEESDTINDSFNFIYSSKRIARLIRDSLAANMNVVKITKRGLMITPSKGITVYTQAEI